MNIKNLSTILYPINNLLKDAVPSGPQPVKMLSFKLKNNIRIISIKKTKQNQNNEICRRININSGVRNHNSIN